MQYVTTQGGVITAMADWQFPGSALADKAIVRGWDGALCFEGDPRIEKPQSAMDAERAVEIRARLTELDATSARPLRAVVAGSATDDDRARLAELEAEAQVLREELATLERSLAPPDTTPNTPNTDNTEEAQ